MLNKETIKEIELANGFKLKEQANGEMDLNPYVYSTINKAIEFYESKKNGGWISVDDMSPKEFETVLLFGKKYNGEPLIINGHLVQSLVDEFGIEEGFSVPIFITHWQPLPQPPKE